MYRAIIEVEEFYRSGWDSYHYTYEVYTEAPTKEECKKEAEKKIKYYNEKSRKGDFGIVLQSYEAKLKHIEKFSVVKE